MLKFYIKLISFIPVNDIIDCPTFLIIIEWQILLCLIESYRFSLVAPTFIKKLHSYRGYVYNAPNVSIMCWVECAPICTISWLRDDIPMNFTKTNRYYVSNVYHPPDPRTDDFESIQSTLIWNLTVWPNGQLDRAEDNVKFTCKSSSNGIGPGVESFTHFHVECMFHSNLSFWRDDISTCLHFIL